MGQSANAPLRQLSPLRKTTGEDSIPGLVEEQLRHFAVDPEGDYGRSLARLAASLYEGNLAVHELWRTTLATIEELPRADRIALFNAKRFASFQLAKILDNLQNPFRAAHQSLMGDMQTDAAQGSYPVFDNVPALFSSTPVITRTSTYIYACMEWGEDAFKGQESLSPVYSRLLNPTAISLANYIVDLEAGRSTRDYLAWNFNSGMAAVDALFGMLLKSGDIVVASRNVYGGVYQLLEDWYAKPDKLGIAVEWVDGSEGEDFARAIDRAKERHAGRLERGASVHLYLESPCNPHGFVLDVPAIARAAHERGCLVACDSTVGTPALQPLLRHEDPAARPDFVIYSFTKDVAGSGSTTAGCVIGPGPWMFAPKGGGSLWRGPDGKAREIAWDETMFWNVFYVKGGFLDADKAFEVLQGAKTMALRMREKAANTLALVRCLEAHPQLNVRSPAATASPNRPVMERCLIQGLPPPLFTVDFEGREGGPHAAPPVPPSAFKRFFDMLEPALGLQVSLGQTNTIALCPASSSHSELGPEEQRQAGIAPTTLRISVGLEDPRFLIHQMQEAARLAFGGEASAFAEGFPSPEEIDRIYAEACREVHEKTLAARKPFAELTA